MAPAVATMRVSIPCSAALVAVLAGCGETPAPTDVPVTDLGLRDVGFTAVDAPVEASVDAPPDVAPTMDAGSLDAALADVTDAAVEAAVDAPSPRLPTLDFGRSLQYIPDATRRAAAYDAFARRVDLAEASLASPQLDALTSRNPAIAAFDYMLDLTACFHQQCGASLPLDTTWSTLPETSFLHFAEATTLHFYALDGHDLGTVDIPGCAAPAPATAACRARTFVWGDSRYLFATGDAAFRTWMAARLLATTGGAVRGVFLDEHAHRFNDAMKFGSQSRVERGGALREYAGAHPGDAALDTAWNADVVGALAQYRTAFAAQGRFVMPNLATYFTAPEAQAQALAAGGVSVEGLWRPDAFDGTDRFFDVVRAVRAVAAAGGVVDLYGTLGYTGPSGYGAGGYADAPTRYRMWRLAASFLAQPDAGDRGTVYFDPTLAIDFGGDPLAWVATWLPAYATSLGVPLAAPDVASRTTYTSTTGVACTAVVLRRTFARGTVLVRAKDAWNCPDWDGAGIVTVTLPHALRPLQPDGTAGPATDTVRIRNAEAWILLEP